MRMSGVNKKILIVEDEQEMRVSLFEALTGNGYDVAVAEHGLMALAMLHKSAVDLIISDIRMPEMDGLTFLQKARISHPLVPVIMITGFATVDTAIEAMKKGAYDYILKPFPMEVVEESVRRCLANESFAPADQASDLPSDGTLGTGAKFQRSRGKGSAKAIIGSESNWLRVVEKAKAVASSTATVLILGESGTGKEVLARFIHNESDRCEGPFVALNCAALPDGLLESELFGHEKGAFTGAINAKKGKFELADGGTLLLDEIGEVPLHLQAKLLRVLQEGEVDRLGGKAPVKFDVHVLATTNRNLTESVEKGEFRQDLFYRLNVIPLRLPSLKERKKDILLLADFFVERYSLQYQRHVKKLSPLSQQRFMEYAWPGNVREMENMIERAVLLSQGSELEPWDLWDEEDPEYIAAPAVRSTGDGAAGSPVVQEQTGAEGDHLFADATGSMVLLRDVERQMIMQALDKTDNNRTHAAKMLGISVRTLRNKLHEYRNKGLIE